MTTPELIAYIHSELDRGVKPDQIRAALDRAGWQEESVKEAFNIVEKESVQQAPIPQPSSSQEMPGASVLPHKEIAAADEGGEKVEEVVEEKPVAIAQPTVAQPSIGIEESVSVKSPEQVEQQPERSKKKILVPLLIVAGLLVVGGGVYGYFTHFSSSDEVMESGESVVFQDDIDQTVSTQDDNSDMTEDEVSDEIVDTLEYRGQGVSFSYPADWNIEPRAEVIKLFPTTQESEELFVWVFINQDTQEGDISEAEADGWSVEEDPITIAGVDTTKYTMTKELSEEYARNIFILVPDPELSGKEAQIQGSCTQSIEESLCSRKIDEIVDSVFAPSFSFE